MKNTIKFNSKKKSYFEINNLSNNIIKSFSEWEIIYMYGKYQVFNLSDYKIIKIKMFSFNVLFQLYK